MFSKLKYDISASIAVFLVAIPLCSGIALASGAPMLSGLISGIIGGIIVGIISSSQTSVSGPAAGLAAVVFASIEQLGSFEVFLAAVLFAGVFQLLFGVFRGGFISAYVPSNVIQGLLAAIGIILILKQIPHAVGFDRDAEGDFSFMQRDGENTFSELLNIVYYVLPGALLISSISLIILILWERTSLRKIRFFPASLLVVIFGVTLNQIFINYLPGFAIAKSHLLTIPKIKLNELDAFMRFPDFSQIGNYKLWLIAFTIAVIASLETLLNLEAVDNIDPQKRNFFPNKELIAQGIGNIFAGLMGGIPVSSVIVRSSVNINSENKTKASTIIHGFLILISVFFINPFLNLIPLSSMAAILLFAGYKLAKVSLFKSMYKKGLNQFIPFLSTIIAIVFTDILIGILIGLAISIFFILRNNYKNPFVIENKNLLFGETLRIELSNQASFLNKASIKSTLSNVPFDSKVIIDASYCDYVDIDVLEVIQDFSTIIAPQKNIQVNVIGLREKYKFNDYIQFVNVLDKEAQDKLTPDEILEMLKAGNKRFVDGQRTEKYYKHQVGATSDGQFPMAVLISCIDSRTAPEIIFDSGLGDLLSIRIAGNIVSDAILGSIEIACDKLGAKLIVVIGHSKCGAIKLAAANVTEGKIAFVTDKIDFAIKETPNASTEINDQWIDAISWLNVHNSVAEIIGSSKYVHDNTESGNIKIVAAFYDVETGKVTFER